MRIIKNISYSVLFLFLAVSFTGKCCDLEVTSQEIKTQWVIQDYALYYFVSSDNTNQVKYADSFIAAFHKKWADTVNLKIMKISGERGRDEILTRFKVKDRDVRFLLVSPYNEVLWRSSQEKISEKTLDGFVQSPLRRKMPRALEKYDVLLLLAVDKKSKERGKVISELKDSVNIAGSLYGLSLCILQVDCHDKREEFLLNNLGFKDEPLALAFILGRGKVLAEIKGKVTQESVLDRLQAINRTCFCTLAPFWGYRKDLLLSIKRKGL